LEEITDAAITSGFVGRWQATVQSAVATAAKQTLPCSAVGAAAKQTACSVPAASVSQER